jgi:hypothetical protein
MDYRIILTKNNKLKKILYKSKDKENAFLKYREIKKENKKVIFPKKYINYKGIKKVEYKILIVKDIENDDKNRFVRDEFGRVYEEKPFENKWTILDSSEYNVEETFWIYGNNPKKDRKTIKDVIKLLLKNNKKRTKEIRQIIVVHNKLIIHSEDYFQMVICKNIYDAQRLHHNLKNAATKNKIKNLLFLGTATPSTISRMYKIIHENTGWKYEKIRRTTTRP